MDSLVSALNAAGFVGQEGYYRHFLQYGHAEDVSPNAGFNASQYYIFKAASYYGKAASAVTDAEAATIKSLIKSAGMDAWTHYEKYGTVEQINASNSFDTAAYLQAKAAALNASQSSVVWTAATVATAIQNAGMSAYEHYMNYKGAGTGEVASTAVYTVDQSKQASNPGQTFALTTGIDNFTGTSGNDIFNAVDSGASATFTALDKIDGGAGVDTLNITQAAAFGTVSSATVKNIETANITSALAVNADVSGWTGLTTLNVVSSAAAGETITAATSTAVNINNSSAQSVTVVGGGTTASVTTGGAAIVVGNNAGPTSTDANAFTSVTTTGGTTVAVTDNSGTAGAIGSMLTTATISGNAGLATLTGKGLTTVNLANNGGTGSATIVNSTTAHTLNLGVNAVTGGVAVTDAAATTVNLTATGAKVTTASDINLTTVAATALNVDTSAALTLTTTSLAATDVLQTMTVKGAGSLTADLSGISSLTAVDASVSTGTNTIILDATKSTFAGGSGVDTVTIAAAPTKVIAGGAGANDMLVVNFIGGFNASANTNISGFETLALGALADASSYDATGFAHLAVGNAIAGDATFSNVAAGTDLDFTAASTKVVTYSLANALGLSDSVNISAHSASSIANAVTATGIETINLAATHTGTGTSAIMDSFTLSAAPTSGATTKINVTSGALTGVTLVDTTDTTISSVNASGVQGDGQGTAGTGFVWTTGALAATTPTTATTITGSAHGGDVINAAAALDLVTITATSGTNTLTGSLLNKSVITGGTGADTITGGNLADTIVGGGGADVITGGAGADLITVSGNTAKIVQTSGASGTNSATNVQTSELTSTFDVIKGLVAGDKIDLGNASIVTAGLTLAGTNLASAGADKAVFASGTYDAAAGAFTFSANGADTALTYDSSSVASDTPETIILVGYHAGSATAAAAGIITLA